MLGVIEARRNDIDADALTVALAATGFKEILDAVYPLRNGKTLVHRDYRKL